MALICSLAHALSGAGKSLFHEPLLGVYLPIQDSQAAAKKGVDAAKNGRDAAISYRKLGGGGVCLWCCGCGCVAAARTWDISGTYPGHIRDILGFGVVAVAAVAAASACT